MSPCRVVLVRSHARNVYKSACLHTTRNCDATAHAWQRSMQCWPRAAVQHTHAMIGHGMLRAHLRASRVVCCSVEHPHLTRSCSSPNCQKVQAAQMLLGLHCACVQLKSARTIYRSRECASAGWLEHNLECVKRTLCVGVWGCGRGWAGGHSGERKWLFPRRARRVSKFQPREVETSVQGVTLAPGHEVVWVLEYPIWLYHTALRPLRACSETVVSRLTALAPRTLYMYMYSYIACLFVHIHERKFQNLSSS
jgi:hypothetical protein